MTENSKNIVIIGDGYVGKTSILNAIRENKFEEQIPNVYDEFEFSETINGTQYRLKFIDTAGQEEYEMWRKLCYREADIFLLCFAVDDKVSFENMQTKWYPDLREYRHVPIILVGTKLDLRNSNLNCISKENVVRFQKQIGVSHYVECSAKTGEGIIEIKKKIVRIVSSNPKEKSCTIQ